jgi:putative FmdB family regulatory protein
VPIYEYQCSQCSHRLESFEKMTDEPLTHCPACGKSTLQKLVSAAGFQLKGTGWYATDFGSKAKPESTLKKEESANAPSASDSKLPDKKDSNTNTSTDVKTTSTAAT